MEEKDRQKENSIKESVQKQFSININRLRKEQGLEPIDGGDKDFISIEEEKLEFYLQKFRKNIDPKRRIIEKEIDPKIKKIALKIIQNFKKEELTYVDAYVTLEYVYDSLKTMSEYTHL